MTPQEQEDAKVRADLQRLAKLVDSQLPFGWGFIVLSFPFEAGGRMNYVSNAERADVVRALYEFIETTKNQWMEHEPPLGAAAEDEQLARARQRIAQLEGQALNATNLKDLDYLLEIAQAHLVVASPFNFQWRERAQKYREIFHQRLMDLEK